MYDASELPDFLATVSAETDPRTALERGLALIAEVFDADVVAFVHCNDVVASAGPGMVDRERLFVDKEHGRLTFVGFDTASVSSIDLVESDGVALIARTGSVLTHIEAAHAEVMARALELTVRLLEKAAENERLLEEHRAHAEVLAAILRVQRLISQRQPVESILDAITSEALSLLGADLGGVSLASSSGPWRHSLVAATDAGRAIADDVAERTISERGLYASIERPGTPRVATFEGGEGRRHRCEIIGTPVSEDGTPVGALFVVVAGGAGSIDRAAMELFASQASIALTDAWTVNELEHAFHDPLTGLPNRALFQDRFEHALDLGARRMTPTGLLFLDLDRFKRVNDTLGHAAGDELLRAVGAVLSAACRTCDSVARLGGDEFALVLEDTDATSASAVANRLLAALSEVVNPTDEPDGPGVSIGIACSAPDCSSVDELMRRADIAMYAAKANGPGQALLYDSSMGQSRLDQNGVAMTLMAALDRDEFVVHYQPIVDLRTKQVSSVEALVRWEDPERGLVAPGAFIDDAETTGVIVEIGKRVLEIACTQAASWRRDLSEAADLHLSVNVSTRQLWHDGFKDDVRSVLDETGLDPAALVLEVTESVFLDDAVAAGERLQELKDLGVRLAIDDFGTGFSSLSYVHNYPFDILKIDRAFVEGIGTSVNGGAIVRTMLALAQQLSMGSVAEGIETVGELAQLRALRCSHGQGFLFSKPVPAQELEATLLGAGVVSFPAPMTSA